jgi:transcriptional regulator with GAF, ATPase, and Fis domain
MPKPLPTTPAGDPTTIPALRQRHDSEIAAAYEAALGRHGGNRSAAARELGVTPKAVDKAIVRYGLEAYATAERGRPPGRKAAEP